MMTKWDVPKESKIGIILKKSVMLFLAAHILE